MFEYVKHRCLKIFTSGLVLIFFLTNAALAYAPQTTIWAERTNTKTNRPSTPTPEPTRPFNPILFTNKNRRSYLKIKSPHSPLYAALKKSPGSVRGGMDLEKNQNRVVIHIQDVHQNPEAQTNISTTLDNLFQTHHVGLLGLEGTFSSINLSRFRNFSDQKTLKNVSDYFLKKGAMAGSIYASLLSPSIPTLTGIDDKVHYNANVNAFRTSYKQIETSKSKLSNAQKNLNLEKAKTFSRELYAFDQRVEAYRRAEIPLSDYVGLLTSNNTDIPLQLELFKETLRMESNIDFKKVELERSNLIEQLVKKLSPQQTETLTQISHEFRLRQVTAADFYTSLQQLCNDAQIPLAPYPAFDSFVRYTLMADSIDMDTVLAQLENVETATYASFHPTAEQKELIDFGKYLYLADKLIDYSLSSKEWTEYKETSPNPSIGKHGGEYSSPRFVSGEARRGLDLSAFEKFYEEATARDAAMANNLLRRMQDEKTNVAILVTGGFHSDGISKQLADKGVATIKFVPTLTKVENKSGAEALSVFNQEKGVLDELFEGTKLFLTVDPTHVLPKVAAAVTAAGPNGNQLLNGTPIKAERVAPDQIRLSANGIGVQTSVTLDANGNIQGFNTQRAGRGRPTVSKLIGRIVRWLDDVERAIEQFFSSALGILHMVPPQRPIGLRDIDKETKNSVLAQLFLHTDGIGLIAPAWKLHTSGILELFVDTDSHNPLTFERIVEHARKTRRHVNEGFLEAALWALTSQGWIGRQERGDKKFNYFVTEKGKEGIANIHVYKPIFDYLPDIIRMNEILFTYPSSIPGNPTPRDDPDEKTRLRRLIELSKRGWDLPETMNKDLRDQMKKQMDGLLMGPIMVELRDKLASLRNEEEFEKLTTESQINIENARAISQSMGHDRKITETDVIGKTEILEMVFDLFAHQGWVTPRGNHSYSFTTSGLEEMRLAWSYGVPVSYAPLYNQWETLLFDQRPEKVFEEDEEGNERHVNRLMNAKSSGYTHRKSYMEHPLLKQKLKAIFNQPLENQPKFVADMGCGDGALLRLIFDYIKKNTLRGQHLDTHPLLIIGADYNHSSQAITKFNMDLAGISNNDVIFGNINDPDRYAKDLKKKFGLRMKDGLHVRSMLDHNRPFIEPNLAAAAKRKGRSKGVFIRPNGSIIPNNVVERNLYEHYKKWANHIGTHGLLTIELQTLPPEIAAKNIGKIMTTSYAMSHFTSCQYTIEADIDIDIAKEAGFEVNDPIYLPKDLPMVTIKHLTVAPKPATWGISGKNVFNTFGTALVSIAITYGLVSYLQLSPLAAWSIVVIASFSFLFQAFVILVVVTEADQFRYQYNLVFSILTFLAKVLHKLPGKPGKYFQDLYEGTWLPKIKQWASRQDLIGPLTDALELNRTVPKNASRWLRIKYFFRQFQIIGIQYGDIAVNRKAMALLPPIVQYWFLRHAMNLMWFKLAVRHQYKAPAVPTFWDYFKETMWNIVEGVVVNLADIIPFVRASIVSTAATEHMRSLMQELPDQHIPKVTQLLEIPELADVFGMKIWAKMESEHQSTAFKYRIIGQLLNWFGQMTAYERSQYDKVLVASTGNQALAVSMAVQILRKLYPHELANLKAVTYVSSNIDAEKMRKLQKLGVEVIQHGFYINRETGKYHTERKPIIDYGDASESAEFDYLHDPKALFIHHGSINVMAAYGTIDEMDSQLEQKNSATLPTAVLVPLGAGGLYAAIKRRLINIQKRLAGLRAWLTMKPKYRRYRTIPVITNDVVTSLISQGLKETLTDFYLPPRTKANGISVPRLDKFALMEVSNKDQIHGIDGERLDFARMILINLTGRLDIEHTSSLPLAILTQFGARYKAEGFKQIIMIISGGNVAEPDPKDPTKMMTDEDALQRYWLDKLIEHSHSGKVSTREGNPDKPLTIAALKKHLSRTDLGDEDKTKINAAIEALRPTGAVASAPANAAFLMALALDNNPTQARLNLFKKIGQAWTFVEAIGMATLSATQGFETTLIVSIAMFVIHFAALIKIGKSPYLNDSLLRNAALHFAMFLSYAVAGYFAPLLGAAHIAMDLRYFQRLPQARSLGVRDAGPIVRTVELSQSKNIDRVLLPVLADLARFPKLKVAFNVAPIGDDKVDTIAAAVLFSLAGKNAPRDRITFNLDGELSLEAVLAEAHSGQAQKFSNGLWKTPFAKQSARIELIKTTDRWTPMSGTLKVGDWMTVTVSQVLQVLFRIDDESVDLGTMIQGALAAMKAA